MFATLGDERGYRELYHMNWAAYTLFSFGVLEALAGLVLVLWKNPNSNMKFVRFVGLGFVIMGIINAMRWISP